jgi:hypothetical protein
MKLKNVVFISVLCFVALFSVCAQHYHLIYENMFVNNSDLRRWQSMETPNNKAIIISNSVKHKGFPALQVTLNKDDSLVANSKRAEVTLKPEDKVEVERWVGFSVMFPTSFIPDPEPESIQQWHDLPDLDEGGVWRSPPFALYTKNGRLYLDIKWSSQRLTSNATLSGGKTYDLGVYSTGVWTDLVYHIKFSWNNDGLIDFWNNGKKILTINGPNAYNDKRGNYFKLGIYKWMWAPVNATTSHSNTTKRVVYYSNLRVGNELATYNDVAP